MAAAAAASSAMTFALFFLLVLSIVGAASAKVYKVGGPSGWTTRGSPKYYTNWAAKISFHVGDTLVFKYDPRFHNVKMVTLEDYRTCNPSSPLATYHSGHDTIHLKKGHYNFIDGFNHKCRLGQKVSIRVPDHAPSSPPAIEFVAPKVYKVGDSHGWSNKGEANYTAWAAAKEFHVGDTVAFEYNKKHHNVMEVRTLKEYRACDASSPKWTSTSGKDSITFQAPGHYFYISGVHEDCVQGQKVDIRIPKDRPYATTSNDKYLSTSDSPALGGIMGMGLTSTLVAMMFLLLN